MKHSIENLPFKVSSRTILMLGRENISSSVVALIELIKNAYDADATEVNITFTDAMTSNGTIVIEDDGDGMDITEIKEQWLLVGTDAKEKNFRTGSGRVKTGKKGIGRLSLDRLADKAVMETFKANGKDGLSIAIDWTKYLSSTSLFNEVLHPVSVISKTRAKGTTIQITDLRDKWDLDALHKLRNDLSLLIPSSASGKKFSVHLNIVEHPELSGPVSSRLTEVAEYNLTSTLSSKGTIKHELVHKSGKSYSKEVEWIELFPKSLQPACGPLNLSVSFYLLNENFGTRSADIKSKIKSFQGVRIYRDGFRVLPYGEPGGQNDWLQLNARRVASPGGIKQGGWRVSENQVVGHVDISRIRNPSLEDQTNREGLFENKAYYDMKNFALSGIQFLETQRRRYELSKERATPTVSSLLEKSKKILKTEATKQRDMGNADSAQTLTQVSQNLGKAKVKHEELQSENQLMMGLATLGIAMAAFGHETQASVNKIANSVGLIENDSVHLQAKPKFAQYIRIIKDNNEVVKKWGRFALDHVQVDKRRRQTVKLKELIENTTTYFNGIFAERNISIEMQLDSNIKITAYVMDIEALLLNLLTNAIEALRSISHDKRKIEISLKLSDTQKSFILSISDSGKGVDKDHIDLIFRPLFSTRRDGQDRLVGTGLGLTISREIVSSYDGNIEVVGNGKLGGATFIVTIPVSAQVKND